MKFGADKSNDSSEKRVFFTPRVVTMSKQRAMNKVIGDVHRTLAGLAVRIFPATTLTLTKDTALSEQGRGAAWHVWINAQYGRGTAWARHAMCESALRVCDRPEQGLLDLFALLCTWNSHTTRYSWRMGLSLTVESMGNIFTDWIYTNTLKRDSWFLEGPRVSKKMDSDSNGGFHEGTRHKKVEKRNTRKTSVDRRPGRSKKNKNKRPGYRKSRKMW
jgi:hypothetical protein